MIGFEQQWSALDAAARRIGGVPGRVQNSLYATVGSVAIVEETVRRLTASGVEVVDAGAVVADQLSQLRCDRAIRRTELAVGGRLGPALCRHIAGFLAGQALTTQAFRSAQAIRARGESGRSTQASEE